jgi:hypothetical protein
MYADSQQGILNMCHGSVGSSQSGAIWITDDGQYIQRIGIETERGLSRRLLEYEMLFQGESLARGVECRADAVGRETQSVQEHRQGGYL